MSAEYAGFESSRVLSSLFGGGLLRPVPRLVAWGVAAAVGVTLGVAADAAVSPAPAQAAPPKAAAVALRPDTTSAVVTARAQGSRVEVENLRDEFTTTWANPDGTLTTDQNAGPIRYRDSAGALRDVNLELAKAPDGSVGPKGHPLGLRLASGAKGADGVPGSSSATSLVSLTENAVGRDGAPVPGGGGSGGSVGLVWPGRLPEPVLEGTKATYRDVKPGVDVVVESRRTGFEQHLVVRNAIGLASLVAGSVGGLVPIDLPLVTKDVTARTSTGGAVEFVNAAGTVVSRFAAPLAWDGRTDRGSGDPAALTQIGMSLAQVAGKPVLRVSPSLSWLTDPGRVFPITIDPTYASGSTTPSFDTYVSSAFPTATYSTSTELRVGTYNGGGDKYRSFLNFPISGIHGKDIVSANLSLNLTYSYSCTPSTFFVYSATLTNSSTNWNNQPPPVNSFGSASWAKGYSSSCPGGRVSVPITGLVDAWSNATGGSGGLRLHASETSNSGWKKFTSVDGAYAPVISYTYNRKPNLAATPTVEGGNSYTAPGSSTALLFTNKVRPVLSTVVTDPDASNVYSNIQVHTSTTGSNLVTNCRTTGYVASGAKATCTVPVDLADNTTYYLRASAGDERGLSNGGWSPWRTFYMARSTPAAPVITCSVPKDSWTDQPPASNVTCTISAKGTVGTYDAPAYINLTVDGVKSQVKITPSGDPNVAKTTVTIARTKNGGHSIVATGTSRSLVTSAASSYGFGWGGAEMRLPTPGTASSGKVQVSASSQPRGASSTVQAKIQWRVAGVNDESTGWTDAGPAVSLTAPTGSALETFDSSWALSNAVREAGATSDLSTRIPVLLDLQVCFTYSGVSTPQCTWSQSPTSVTRVPHAFGNGYPTAGAGPGQVALFTGEFNASATDVTVPGYSSDLAISRSHISFDGDGTVANWPQDATTGIFGPGWTASLEGPEAGAAGMQVIDNTLQDGTIVLVDDEGSALVFREPTKKRSYVFDVNYVPVNEDAIDSAARLRVTGTVQTPTALVLTDEDGTTTTWTPASYSATAATRWKPGTVREPGQVGATTYVGANDNSGRIARIIAPVPPDAATPPGPAVTCAATGPLNPGCRALDITYSDVTVGGVQVKRATSISATVFQPTPDSNTTGSTGSTGPGGSMTTVVVAKYTYDTNGRLTTAVDPRSNTGTRYTWVDLNGVPTTRLASVQQVSTDTAGTVTGGLAAYNLSYDTTAGTPRLTTVTRNPATSGGSVVTLSRYAYDVPLSGTGLPDLTSDDATDPVKLWDQNSAPVNGYAVFGQDYTGPISGAGVDWKRASLQYVDDQGYTVNTAQYGAGRWLLTATDYNDLGNTTREIDATATGTVTTAAANGQLLDDAEVDQLSTQTVYYDAQSYAFDATGTNAAGTQTVMTPAGTLVKDVYGPVRYAVTNSDNGGDGVDDSEWLRPHTRTTYDEGAPTSGYGAKINPISQQPYRLPTTVTVGAVTSINDTTDVEVYTTTTNDYDKLNSADTTEGNPWALGTPTKVTTALAGGNIVRTTRYDTEGAATETRQPRSATTADAGVTRTVRYTAAANTTMPACGNRPVWAGLACAVLPAAAPNSGPTLPSSRTADYNMWLQPTTVVETSGTSTRTTKTSYDDAGRTTASWTTTTGFTAGGTRPGTYTHYDANGLVDYTGVLNENHDAAEATGRSTATYDLWGRTTSSTNGLGDTTATTYIAAGQPGAGSAYQVTDTAAGASTALQRTTYSYDGTDADGKTEARGMVTGQTVTRAATGAGAAVLAYSAAYDPAGNMVTQKLPGKLTQRTSYDAAGEPVGLTYTGTVQPVKPRLDGNGNVETGPDGANIYDPDGPALDDQSWLAWTIANDTQGRVRLEATGPAAAFDGNPGVIDSDDITASDIGAGRAFDRSYKYDTAGRLVQVSDQSAATARADLHAAPCNVRTYTFDTNGRRIGLTEASHTDGNCTGTTGIATTSKNSNYYDTADRPTKGNDGTSSYVYDTFGRQTTVPAVDAPNPAAGNITLGYFDDDLPRSITQGSGSTSIATSFTLDTNNRRLTSTTSSGGAAAVTTTRHYNDSSDNPAWVQKGDTITRYGESIGGDLGYTLATDGTANLTLANQHGDIVTTVDIPAAQDATTAAAGINGWSDYTEYGTPVDATATNTVGGTLGYGWLGAKQRSTSNDTAGLTLMGDRLYNAVTGQFASIDPVPGGNDTRYNYPCDPMNQFDLDGRSRWYKRAWHVGRAVRNAQFSVAAYGYARASGARCQRGYGLTLRCTGAKRFAKYGGITIGNVWVTKGRASDYDRNFHRHERRHSTQWAVLGSNFIGSYAIASGISAGIHRIRPRRGCSNRWACYNSFEMNANLRWGRYQR